MKKLMIVFLCFITLNVKGLELNSSNAILYNLNDDEIIYKLNSDDEISIASLTKIMTVIVAIENIDDYDVKTTITNKDFKGLYNASLAGFYVGEKVTYNDLLYGTFLPSGADAAQALANNVAGSIDSFVDLMNEKVLELGLLHTHFANVTGLDTTNNYSSVQDIATILKYALKNDKFKEIFTTKTYTTSDEQLNFVSTFWATSYKYNYNMEFVLGAKTGYTDNAGKCLASTSYDKINNINYMLVTCGASVSNSDAYHVKDAYNIYNYYFENYKYQVLVSKGDILTTLKTKYSEDSFISFASNEDVLYYLNNNYDKNLIKITYNGLNEISFKNKKGDKLGTVDIYYDNELVKTIDIILNDEYKFSLFSFLKETRMLYIIIGFIVTLLFVSLFCKKQK